MRVVCNTSPLIFLAKIHRLDLLYQLYDEVLVPAEVLKELEAKPTKETKQIRALLQNRRFHLGTAGPDAEASV
uniref:PIN domain-containing protein n=1 Tax=Acetithermum autotrophicum TaxID=1446466 RepID=H5SVC5_ACEAU|nr:hypothetical protein HGMM_OP4C190 [Candidatus Acetothermum autotrophicum]